MNADTDKNAGKCPVVHGTTNLGMRSNSDWWPNQLNLKILRQNSSLSNPMGEAVNTGVKVHQRIAVKIHQPEEEGNGVWPLEGGARGG
jgi:catalase (peroxidase I)